MWAVTSIVKQIISLYSQDLQSEYKVGVAYIQFTVQTTGKVSLMTVDLNTKLMTVLNAGNSVLRLKTWDLNINGRKC